MNVDGSSRRRMTHNFPGNSGPAWSPDGKRIAFKSDIEGQVGDGDVSVMKADGTHQHQVTHDTRGGAPTWSPDGERIAFSDYRTALNKPPLDLYTIGADGNGRRWLTRSPGDEFQPAWSPNGRMILFVSDRSGHDAIYVMDADGKHQRRLA